MLFEHDTLLKYGLDLVLDPVQGLLQSLEHSGQAKAAFPEKITRPKC
jgi:hypothetical protein